MLSDELARLRADFINEADRRGLIDVAYRTVDSPIGPLLLASTEAGLVRVAFAVESHESVLDQLAKSVSPRLLERPGRLDPVARQLDEYFARTRRSFELAIDYRLSTGFRRSVLEHLTAIDYGHTESYSAVAQAVGNPNAVRAAGTACATNPLPVIVPCHRVVRMDGSFGGYLGGTAAKRFLLELETQGNVSAT